MTRLVAILAVLGLSGCGTAGTTAGLMLGLQAADYALDASNAAADLFGLKPPPVCRLEKPDEVKNADRSAP